MIRTPLIIWDCKTPESSNHCFVLIGRMLFSENKVQKYYSKEWDGLSKTKYTKSAKKPQPKMSLSDAWESSPSRSTRESKRRSEVRKRKQRQKWELIPWSANGFGRYFPMLSSMVLFCTASIDNIVFHHIFRLIHFFNFSHHRFYSSLWLNSYASMSTATMH